MGIKFWEGKEDEEVFVRFDNPPSRNVLVYLCDERGEIISGGNVILRSGEAIEGICRDGARRAGITLGEDRRISHDSLAQICAEMAKRIQE